MTDSVVYTQTGRLVHLQLNRPDTRNALSADVIEGLVSGLDRANDDPGVSCVVISGAGKGFSSGGNLQEIKAMTTTDNLSEPELKAWYTEGIQRIPMAMQRVDVVTIAAVHGHAIGAGCDLTAMCDMRIAADNASFAESFLRVGLIPGDGGAWFLPRVVGLAHAKEMLFTGKAVKAEQALQWGLVSEVVSEAELLPAAMALAESIAALPPQALRNAKQLIRKSETMPLAESLDMAAAMQAQLQQLDDHREAVDAILEKRKPVFTGK
jgi:enoyl-CoA hydratase/carnithine racemase